jgi:hypothetical protein
MHDDDKKTSKSLLRKTMEGEDRLKYDIQKHVPAAIDQTNIAFQSTSEKFIGVDCSRYLVSNISILALSQLGTYVLLKRELRNFTFSVLCI